MAAKAAKSTRRTLIETLIGLGAAGALYGAVDSTAWRAYEAVEEQWIRDRHALIVAQAPGAAGAARVDLELKLAELQRRALEFKHLLRSNPRQLRGGVWQLSWLPLSDQERESLQSNDAAYRRQDDQIRRLVASLRRHAEYERLRQAQMRLWKTPEYKEIHRKYSGRVQELHRHYGGGAFGAS